MKRLHSPAACRKFLKSASRPVVFVPTMGALHRGHTTLIDRARKLAGARGTVVVSIFVNPTQFGPKEDFSKYPRPLENDLRLCREHKADAVFLPEVSDMYASDASIRVNETDLSTVLCGASRPGHFDGVCTIVAKLFCLLQPDVAVFGEKDWQQLAIIRRMVRDLFIPVKIVGVPTIRESDGLAMSSRNTYLDATARAAAPGIYQALQRAAKEFAEAPQNLRRITANLRRRLRAIPGAELDYAEIVDSETLRVPEADKAMQRPLRAMVAVRLGGARLIDNIALHP